MKQLVPDWARHKYRRLRRLAEHTVNRSRTPEQVFSRIYAQGLWGNAGNTFHSGSGSTEAHAVEYVRVLEAYVAEHSIRSIVDLGCGDFTVGKRIAALGVDYIGVDVVPALIQHHTQHHASAGVRFMHLDIVADPLPQADLCLIRQVLQHLSNDQIARVLRKLSQYEHVLVTEHYPGKGAHVVPNKDKPQGHDTRIEDDSAVFLEHPPFGAKIAAMLLEHETTPLKRSGEVLRTLRLSTR